MGKKHKNKDPVDTEPPLPMDENDVVQPQPSPEKHSTKKKHKNKKIRKREERIDINIETVNSRSDKSLPLVGYFPSGYDPEKRQRVEQPTVRVLKHVKRNTRLQLVVSPSQASPVNFVGTNYSGEAATPQMCSYSLGVFDKQTQTLKIVPIESNKIFRLEPRFGDHDNAADETSLMKVENEATIEDSKTKFNFSTKKSERTARKQRALRAYRDPEAQEDLNTKMADAVVNKEAIADGVEATSNSRNIPPHDMLATTPYDAYPLKKIIFEGEWGYLSDIIVLMQEGRDIRNEAYPLFVCNRIEKMKDVKGEAARDNLACIFSYINHLIKFKDMYSRDHRGTIDGVSSAKHHKLPNILTQKFNDMFAITESKKLVNEKRDLLISYVLVLTLFVDNFNSDISDIAKDLRISALELRPHFEYLGCKLVKEKNKMMATLPVPLKFPEIRMRRRR